MTLDQFAQFINSPYRAKLFYPALVKFMGQYEINTPKRVNAFMAQAAWESENFSALIEITNYTKPETLMKVFPTHFRTLKEAQFYAGKPQAIANHAYANRLGNGAETSGDGYRYRGRGIFQLTGKDWYKEIGRDTIGDPKKYVDNPELLSTPEYAVMSACWFWKTNNLSRFADSDDFKELTRRINGGLAGYDDGDRSDLDSRVDWWERAKKIFV